MAIAPQGEIATFATAYDPPADALYGSVMQEHDIGETWLKKF